MIRVSYFKNKSVLGLIGILFLTAVCYHYVFNKKLDLNGDNVTYYLLGYSLAAGNGYSEIWTKDNAPHTQYPPGYPIIISLFLSFLHGDVYFSIIILKIINGVFFLGMLVLFFFILVEMGIDKRFFPAIILPVALNPYLLSFSFIMMSEIPFLFFTTAAFLSIMKIDFSRKSYRERSFYFAVLFTAASLFIRLQGIALLFGIIFYFLFRRKYQYVLHTIIALTVIALPWIVRVQICGGSPYTQKLLSVDPYNSDMGSVGFVQLLERIIVNGKRYLSVEIPSAFFPVLEKRILSSTITGWIIGISITALLIVAVLKIKNHPMLITGYLIGTFGIILLWPPKWSGVRFMLAIIPLMWLLSTYACLHILNSILVKKAITIKTFPLWFSVIFLFHVPSLRAMHFEAKLPYPPNWQNYFRIADWVKSHTPANTVVSCRKPSFFYLFSRRPTCVYLFSEDNIKLLTDMVKQDVDYVVVDQLGYQSTIQYLVPAIIQNPAFFQKVLQIENPNTYLFKTLGTYTKGEKKEIAGASLLVMALNRFNMKDYNGAEQLLIQSMKTTEKIMGRENKVFSNAMNNLGIIAFMRGQYLNARDLFVSSMEIEQSIIGREHPDIAMSLINIGETYKAEKQYATADSLYQEALKIREKAYGENSRFAAKSLWHLIKFYSSWGKQQQEDAAFDRIVSLAENASKQESKEIVSILKEAQNFYAKSGRGDRVDILERNIQTLIKQQ